MPSLTLEPPAPGGIESIPVEDAVARVRAYCSAPLSGWHTYDRPAHVARTRGVFDDVSPWSILWAEALNGQPRARDIVGFDRALRERIADATTELRDRKLAELDDPELDKVVNLCAEGFSNVWAPKLTKVLALYLPDIVPVLDGNVARAMGFPGSGFRVRSRSADGTFTGRRNRIAEAVRTLRSVLRENAEILMDVRDEVTNHVPDFIHASDVRLLDIILWTSQEDRMKPGRSWASVSPAPYEVVDLTPVTIPSLAP